MVVKCCVHVDFLEFERLTSDLVLTFERIINDAGVMPPDAAVTVSFA